MITEDLIVYIQNQFRKNTSKDTIASRLRSAGWREADIDEAFKKLSPPEPPKITTQEITPQEKELTGAQLPDISTSLAIEKTEKPTEPVFATSFSTANTKDPSISYYIPDNITKTPRKEDDNLESTSVNYGIMRPKIVEITPPQYKPQPAKVTIITPNILQKPEPVKTIIRSEPLIPKQENQELIPTLKPKNLTEPPSPASSIISSNLPKISPSQIIPQNAVLHSYPKILSSSSGGSGELSNIRSKKIMKWFVVILIIGSLVGGVFAFARGYIKLPEFNLPFVKKDPRILLNNASQTLMSMSSYKSLTRAKISIPTFADITNGLVSGEKNSSESQDFISLDGQAEVARDGQLPLFKYDATIKSSFFKQDINTEIDYGYNQTFVHTPDLSGILGENSPPPAIVTVKKEELGSIVALLPQIVSSRATKIDLDKLLSITLPSYTTSQTSSALGAFVGNSSVVEKAPENIHGEDSYHYVLSSDSASTKMLFKNFINIFVSGLTSDEQSSLDSVLGSATLDEFDIWVGETSGNVTQYGFSASVPLSKILGIEDKGIAGNTVSLSWQNTYYDFNVKNNIDLPPVAIAMTDYMKTVTDMQIKNLISSFKQSADGLHNAIGKFGARTNPNGSCTNPNPGSLFSPLGHPKGASNAVGNISSAINNILNITGGAMSCYSTPINWAMSAPLSSKLSTSFCADSTGVTKEITVPLAGTVCK